MHLHLYIDWDYTPGTTPDFTTSGDDITPYYQHVRVRVGGQSGDLVARVGTCEITLRNEDRRFSPLISTAYAGKLVPMKPILIQVSDGATTWTLFRGFIQRISPQPDQHSTRRATLYGIDLLGVLQSSEIDLPLRENVRADQLISDVINYALKAPVATGRLDFQAIPSAGESASISGISYTFTNSLTAPNQVLIGTSPITGRYDTLEALVAAINGWDSPNYYQPSSRPALVRARLSPSSYQTIMDDQPVRFYRLGESSGLTAYDLGSNAAHATYSGPTLGVSGALSGDTDTAASFDGVNDVVTVPTLDLSNRSFTIALWIKPAASPPAFQDLFSVFSAFSTRAIIFCRLYNSGGLMVSFYNDDATSSAGVITFGAWNHLAISYDYAADLTSLYVNGTLVLQSAIGPFVGVYPSISFGAFPAATTYYKGDMDEVSIYLRCLTSAQIATHYAARTVPVGVTLFSMLRGAVGNTLTLSEASTALSSTGSTLSGGADYPTGALSLQTGSRTFPFAGDAWEGSQVNALTALQHIAESERGRFYQQRDGTLTFENTQQVFKDRTKTSVLTLTATSPVVLTDGAVDETEIANAVRVQFAPRIESGSGIVAKINSPIKVPGRWGEKSSDPNLPKVIVSDFGQTVVSLPFTDPDTGQRIGAKDLILPLVPITDWEANEAADGSLTDYTTYTPQQMFFSIAPKASGVDISIKNTALGVLYVRKLQLRGTKLVRYDSQAVLKEDTASISTYGRQERTITLPLDADANFAAAVAEYELDRHATPSFRLRSLDFRNLEVVASVNVFSLKLGDLIDVYEYQTVPSSSLPRQRVCGLTYEIGLHGDFSVRLNIEGLASTVWGIYNDTASAYDTCNYAI